MTIEQDIQMMVPPPDKAFEGTETDASLGYGALIFICDDPSIRFMNTHPTITPHELPSQTTLQKARNKAARALLRHRRLHEKYGTTPCTPTASFGRIEQNEDSGQVRWTSVTS